jgi:hypothetical protein
MLSRPVSLSKRSKWNLIFKFNFVGQQHVSCALWNPKVQCQVHIPITSQMNPLHALESCFFAIQLIFHQTRRFLTFAYSNQTSIRMSRLMPATCPDHLVFVYIIASVIFGYENIRILLIWSCGHLPISCSRLGRRMSPGIMPFSNIPSPYTKQ